MVLRSVARKSNLIVGKLQLEFVGIFKRGGDYFHYVVTLYYTALLDKEKKE